MTLLNLLPPIRIPIPVLNVAFLTAPLVITFLGTSMQVQDYIFSLSFLRAANLVSNFDTFDFIISGGSAGAVLVNELSKTNARILLIEAGSDPLLGFTHVPALAPVLSNHPSVDWQYKTVPLNGSGLGLKNQEMIWPRGKGLGGCSTTNFMIYMNGNRRDFDRWAEHTQDKRWKYENLVRYFRKIEDYHGVWEGNGVHGKNGPLRVEPPAYYPGLNYVMNAAKEMGFDIRDLNVDQKQGFSPIDFTTKRGFRHSTYTAYIFPALKRPNLTIYRYSLATKIHFNEQMKAVGVTFYRHGVKSYAAANLEVIVCGGAINSAQLLMLSGIGSRHHLEEVGIVTLKDLPGVGENLQDHVTTGPLFLLNKPESFLLERDMTVNALLKYAKEGTGPLSSSGTLMAIGAVATSDQSPDWPNVMLYFEGVGTSPIVVRLLDQSFGAADGLVQDYFARDLNKDAHIVLVTLGLPKSRGFIRLRSSSPFDKPLINPKYFSDPNGDDIRHLREAMQLITALYENTTTFQKIGAHLPEKPVPGCEQHVFKSPEYFECYIRTVTLTLYHPTSTCSMGKAEDINSVVDSQLRVFGTQGLRVCDASIMPFITNSNTNSPTIVIGHICADRIKETWNLI